ncbi:MULTISPECIES: hypothetical protein [unclassified Clostridioides]|uniref:hypothetical protein n=1 Tax=unclassified Clostridioides TaxID=2635829 RepID=UPI001D128645|nr:hypothetical protein [Clostridioides sp. ZZV15-6597]MCC0669163.1 hypothetical protein [Clostridioides sp. ZZV14-6153]
MIQEVREEVLLQNGDILHTGDIINVKYKTMEDIKEQFCKGRLKSVDEQFIQLDTSEKYSTSEKTIYVWDLIEIKKVGDENEKDN